MDLSYIQAWDFVEEYALELMPRRHGYPLRTPNAPTFSSRRPKGFKEYRGSTGPQVGDVGQLGDGSFGCLFNIFLPRNHPMNSNCPRSFVPCGPSSTTTRDQYHPADTEINTMRTVPYQGGIQSDEENILYDVGAVLKLPNGARRVDAVEIEHIRKYAIENAPLWIKEGYIGLDDLYLLTGVDLTNMWKIHLQHGPRQVFDLRQDEKGRAYYKESMLIDSPRLWDSTLRGDVSLEHHNQCVFVRGFRIGYRYSEQGLIRRLLQPIRQLLTGGPSIHSIRPEIKPRPGTFKRFLHDSRRRIAKIGIVYDATSPPDFHPLNIINQMLLLQNPLAFVAVTHDEDWMNVITEDDTVFPTLLTLLTRIQKNCDQVRYKDGVYLGSKPHHRLHIETSRALHHSRATTVGSDVEPDPIAGDIFLHLLASIAVSGSIDSRLKNIAQAALNLMHATVRVEVYTREWTLLASRFISAIVSMTCLLADGSRTKDEVWDNAFNDVESLLDRAFSAVQNQAGSVPRSQLLSQATGLRDIIYFNIRLRRVVAPLGLSKQAKASVSGIKTQADIDQLIDTIAQRFQS